MDSWQIRIFHKAGTLLSSTAFKITLAHQKPLKSKKHDVKMDFDGEWLEQQLVSVEITSALGLPSTPASAGASTAPGRRKRSFDASLAEVKPHSRGNNWDENDSILILRAFQYAEEKKRNWESKDIYNNRMFEHFQSLNPSVKTRSAKSVLTRWMEMHSKYKLFFLLTVD